MKNEYAVETKNVTKYYEKTNHIFDNMSISFQTGKIIGLIGKNGSGKTTFIKLISGMTQQNEGDIYILGEKMTCENSVVLLRKYISVLGDANRALYWNISGMDNLEYFLTLKTGKSYRTIPDHILQYIQDFNMEDFIYNRVETYSKGMKQRLLLLISLLSEPKILFMDEPLNGLDYDNAVILKQMISIYSKKKEGTVFLTSHDQHFLNEVCDVQYQIKDKSITERVGNNNLEKTMILYVRVRNSDIKTMYIQKYKAEESKIDEQILKLETDLNNAGFYQEISSLIEERKVTILEARAL